ncbi:duodenase-1-like [Pelodiscus sinensis]|uniref:duodenase-1-like n=1 Tax=Pelodiscus sinensis TaxID=13735 RepID=UPI003F6AD48D
MTRGLDSVRQGQPLEGPHTAIFTSTSAGEIIGGWEAKPHSRPYMAYLLRQHEGKAYICGGFLVKPNAVLTAAHCKGEITVILGAHNIRQWEPSWQVIGVRQQIRHPQYESKTSKNDIMLLQLSRNATLTKEVGLINVTTANGTASPNSVCSVAGWGMTSLTRGTRTLREVNLTVIADVHCQKRYRYYYPSSMLCAGLPGSPGSFYVGDSGGPLVCGGVAEGIVSFGVNNSTAPPVGLTRISHFVPWIKANLP